MQVIGLCKKYASVTCMTLKEGGLMEVVGG